jgi:hypothetical protein
MGRLIKKKESNAQDLNFVVRNFKFNAKDIVTENAALSNVWLEGGSLTY